MKMIRNKRALVRMLEAIIAIMILLGFFIFIMSKQAEKPNIAEDIYKLERQILREVSDNMTLRGAVLSEDNVTVESFISERLSAHPALNFSIAICEPPGKECTGPKLTADIYVDDIVIGSVLGGGQEPKILRLFIWVGAARKVEVPPEAECGKRGCESGENCENCPADCPCASGETCVGGVCTPAPTCTDEDGDGYAGTPAGCGTDCNDTNSAIHPGATEICNNKDDNCDGTIDGNTQSCYDGPAGTKDVGICHGGTKTCTAGSWGSCVGQQVPEEESWGTFTCTDIDENGNPIDNDCDERANSADLESCQ